MDVIRNPGEMRAWRQRARSAGKRVGFVPTMGYLHDGHVSLLRHGRPHCDALVASIFVNPTQFGPNEDFATYPRDVARDTAMLLDAGTDCLYLPEVGDVYPPGYRTSIEVEGLSNALCGRSRPGHFRGVCTVVAKLFHVVAPDEAWFGEKDAQQLRIIRKMVEDLDMPVMVTGCPTRREPDGLAMSSRNVYLAADERAQAPSLHRALQQAQRMAATGETDATAVLARMRAIVAGEAPLCAIDYIEAVDDATLDPVTRLSGRVLVALAVRFGRTRLIDNIVLEMGPASSNPPLATATHQSTHDTGT